jgi:hypothetical protein
MRPVPPRRPLPRLTDRQPLGKSGLRAGPICLGAVPGPETVLAAFDAGINFFFLSVDMHWPLYEGMRRGLEALLARGGGVRDGSSLSTPASARGLSEGGQAGSQILFWRDEQVSEYGGSRTGHAR